MKTKGVQDYYDERFSQCYGCGRLNEKGHQIKTRWDGEKTITSFLPKLYHTSLPGFTYGGLLASLIDCHGTGSAALAYAKSNNIILDGFNAPRFVTGSLKVEYKKPTPLGPEMEIIGNIREVKGRKITVDVLLNVEGELCATGEVIAILVPENFGMKK